jgi:sulfur-oxidizing protein SoxY
MTRRILILPALLAGAMVLAVASAVADDADDDAAHVQRWQAVQKAIFGNRPVESGSALLQLDAPVRALDAALVPVVVHVRGDKPIKGLYLVVDDNPSPVAAHFTFGPAADPREIHLRVRVDQYTELHAIAEMPDGALYQVKDFVKAAGGCSAPSGTSDEQAMQGMGQMKLRTLGDYAPGKSLLVQLLIRHPNFNGMQMNQVTRLYTPARFLDETDVSYDGVSVFHLDSDISMSTDPAITFGFVPKEKGRLDVVARDSKDTTFRHSFDIPEQRS